ncbi:MAG: hypothetical protein KF852_18385 [Saprospiraceae bacterium]|nr:hypothetical protein [Saprospiraceae bacterium]
MKNATLSFGDNLLASGTDSLRLISEPELHRSIAQPAAGLADLCAQLRKVYAINRDSYNHLKKKLPFFCGSVFRDNHRKLEHFDEARFMVLDLDYCFRDTGQFAELKNRLAADERVMLLFESPGGQGLKLVFALQTPLRSTKQFSDSYKAFAREFAALHGVEDFVDFRTADATRVCFLSADPDARYNPLCLEVDAAAYLSPYDAPAQELPTAPAPPPPGPAAASAPALVLEPARADGLDPSVYREILRKLNPGARPLRPPKDYIVPETLERVVEPVNRVLAEFDLKVREVLSINYGKKWVVEHGIAWGEVNLFYGKNGFSVVKSPKRGANPGLNDLLAELITQAVSKLQNPALDYGPEEATQVEFS